VRHTASSTKSFRCSFFSEHYIPNSDQMRTVVSLERKNRELIPTQRFGLREGAAQWITGSTSTPPFVLPSSHQHEMENALLFLISATRVAGKDRCFGQVLLPRPPDERQVGTAILFLSCQHWSTGKRSCHAICDEHSVLYGHVNLLIIFMPHACTRVDHSSCLGESRKGTSSCSASVANPTSTTCEHILS